MPNEQNPAPKPIKVPKDNDKTIPLSAKDKALIAKLYLSPDVTAARAITAFGPKSLDVMETAVKLQERTNS